MIVSPHRGVVVPDRLICVMREHEYETEGGDIAEQAATLLALERGWAVLRPIGDRLAYDIAVDINGCIRKIQVKSSWYNQKSGTHQVDSRRMKTNRREMVIDRYDSSDFDFAAIYVESSRMFYVIPVDVFTSYKSGITINPDDRKRIASGSDPYKDAWGLIEDSCCG